MEGIRLKKNTLNKYDLIEMGYPKNTAKNIIKLARYDMIDAGHNFYENKKVTEIPIKAVESILGYEIKKDG